MKKIIILLCVIFLLLDFSGFAQTALVKSKISSLGSPDPQDNLNINPFAKGRWMINVARRNLGFSQESIKYNNIDQGDQSQFSIDLGTKYFVVNNFAIGLDFDAKFNTLKDVVKQSTNSWSGYVNFTYGRSITEKIGFYGTVGVGLGGTNYKYTSPSNSYTDRVNEYGFKTKIGFPIRLENNSNVYFTPQVYYSYLNSKFDNGVETENSFGLRLKLESYLFCREISCGCQSGHSLAENMYRGGRSFIDFSTMGNLRFSNTKVKYDNNNIPAQEQDNSRISLKGKYMYYVIDNLAVGAELGLRNTVSNIKVNNSKNTNLGWSIAPMLEYNLPFKNPSLNSFFVSGGVAFGGQTTKYTSGPINNTDNYSIIDYCFGLGYNMFFTKKLSLTGRVEYDWETVKEKGTDNKENYQGPSLVLGVRKFF